MLVGIDPFSAEDPMTIYQNILKGAIRFPRNFDKNAKSLIKHLLCADLARRFGNLKGGAEDVKMHRWFAGMNWEALTSKQVEMPYVPVVRRPDDTSNFSNYPDSDNLSPTVTASDDPFSKW